MNEKLLNEYKDTLSAVLGIKCEVTLRFDYIKKCSGLHHRNVEEKTSVITLNHYFRLERLLSTLGHEMAHVQQWDSGDMVQTSEFGRIYKGEVFEDMRTIPHDMRPWEVDAYTMELKIAESLKY